MNELQAKLAKRRSRIAELGGEEVGAEAAAAALASAAPPPAASPSSNAGRFGVYRPAMKWFTVVTRRW